MRILPDAYARKQFADLSAGLTQRERGTRSNFSEPALLLTVRAMPATAANSTFCSERVANSSKQPLHAHALAVNALARFRPSESKWLLFARRSSAWTSITALLERHHMPDHPGLSRATFLARDLLDNAHA